MSAAPVRTWRVKKVVSTIYVYEPLVAVDADGAILAWTRGAGELQMPSERTEEVFAEEVEDDA